MLFNVFFVCFRNSPETSECVIRPDLCRAHILDENPSQWELDYHNQPHIVYFSFTSHVKVGVTRQANMVSRWIDQGAIAAIVIAKTPNRFLAGCIEKQLSNLMSDRTHWSKMLKTTQFSVNFKDLLIQNVQYLSDDLSKFLSPSDGSTYFKFPFCDDCPEKIKSISLDKMTYIEDILIGIKGQYLIFKSGNVLNVRKHSGYEISLECFT